MSRRDTAVQKDSLSHHPGGRTLRGGGCHALQGLNSLRGVRIMLKAVGKLGRPATDLAIKTFSPEGGEPRLMSQKQG